MPRRVYNVTDHWEEGDYPSALAIGDSWFWYLNQNLMLSLTHLKQLRDQYSTVQLLGFNGASLSEYVGNGRYASAINHYLKKGWREGFSEFYISGAGNDAVHLNLALREDCRGIETPDDCFDPDHLRTMLGDISAAIGSVIHKIQYAYKDDNKPLKKFFIQGYDYPVPDGRGFLNSKGWLKPKMDPVGVNPDMDFRKEVVKRLIDKLNDEVFKPYHAPEKGVYYVDTRGTLTTGASYRDDWANEMHPTSHGFGKIADHWLPSLKAAGLT